MWTGRRLKALVAEKTGNRGSGSPRRGKKLAGACGNRTHRGRPAPPTGFEVRGQHQPSSCSRVQHVSRAPTARPAAGPTEVAGARRQVPGRPGVETGR